MVAPGLAQSTGIGPSVVEELVPVGSADAHVEAQCLLKPCVCYFSPTGYHCHGG